MPGRARFDPAERRLIAAAHAVDAPLLCPVCDTSLDRTAIPPRGDVSYVRDRLWVTCPACHRSTILDRRKLG